MLCFLDHLLFSGPRHQFSFPFLFLKLINLFPAVRSIACSCLSLSSEIILDLSQLFDSSVSPFLRGIVSKTLSKLGCKNQASCLQRGSMGLKMYILASELLMGYLEAFVANILQFNFSLFCLYHLQLVFISGPPFNKSSSCTSPSLRLFLTKDKDSRIQLKMQLILPVSGVVIIKSSDIQFY